MTFEASFANGKCERMIEYLDATQAVTIMRDRWASGPSRKSYALTDMLIVPANTDASSFLPLPEGWKSIPAGWSLWLIRWIPSKTLIF